MPAEVYTARDIAAAAKVPERWVETLLARGEIRSVAAALPAAVPIDPDLFRFVDQVEAVRAVRALAAGLPVARLAASGELGRELFGRAPGQERPSTLSLAVSTSLHALVAASVIFIAGLGITSADSPTEPLVKPEPVRLVFLVSPGPGGGGGGGGLKMKAPPTKAERKGTMAVNSPIPARRLPPPIEPPPPKKVEPPPPPIEAKVLPPVMAPVVTAPADTRDREGVMAKTEQPPTPSQGPGAGGGAGTGKGTGLGDGDGSGIGDGSGGGTGGGPYRPGSGVDPPRLLREVRADYSEAARRANLEGEVVLEIVIRNNGAVGDVKVLRGLSLGLNDKAIEAVRQWRFAPARMKGTPVDVVVEVSVEFRLR